MKRLWMISFIAVMILMSLSFVSAGSANACKLDVSIVNQDPYPAIPNSYVDLVFQVSGVQNTECGGARFELVPSYPFSLDTNDTSRILSGDTFISENKNEWMIPYKIRVNTDALDGNSTIEVHYAPGTSGEESYTIKKFDIAIKDSRTTFDAVIQETSGSDVSIAIANTGKYTANSVVVRIPEQESYEVSGTDGQMVGNLESGDYTIVGFTITSKGMQSMLSQNITKGSAPPNNLQNLSNKLKFDIYYTDNIGERRIVNMELPLKLASNSSLQNGFALKKSSSSNSFFSKWYAWVIIIAVILLLFGFYRKYKSRIKAKILSRRNKKNSSNTPDWVKNAKEKERKK